ncbi:MAG TPA: hypothetical protein V6C86_10780 [Oculatellaceae cyanobacterium]
MTNPSPNSIRGTTHRGSQPSSELQRTAESYLINGDLAKNEQLLAERLKGDKKNDELRFSLGILQFLEAVSRLMESIHYYGLREYSTQIFGGGLFRLPIAHNATPRQISYLQIRDIVNNLLNDLQRAENTLAGITNRNVKLPVHFGQIRLSLTSTDDKLGGSNDEYLWKVYSNVTGTSVTPDQAANFLICFDDGDVHWLRGYLHLLMAICEVYLAYDSEETFNCCAHLIFAKVATPYKFLSSGKRVHSLSGSDADIVDLVSVIHTIRWPLKEPTRLKSALHHLQTTVSESKVSWASIMAETDDDREWLPNPRQTGVIPGATVTQPMIDSWLAMMDQAGKILDGELLIPFWRGPDGTGVNLRKAFLEPTNLDLVLWVQGPAAAPYLEKGTLAKSEPWLRLPREFGSQLPGFALWFN